VHGASVPKTLTDPARIDIPMDGQDAVDIDYLVVLGNAVHHEMGDGGGPCAPRATRAGWMIRAHP